MERNYWYGLNGLNTWVNVSGSSFLSSQPSPREIYNSCIRDRNQFFISFWTFKLLRQGCIFSCTFNFSLNRRKSLHFWVKSIGNNVRSCILIFPPPPSRGEGDSRKYTVYTPLLRLLVVIEEWDKGNSKSFWKDC